jgi:replication factor C small subunit
MLLVEKYRPKKLSEVVGLDPSKINIGEDMPHLLLYGPPGTGKTSLAKIIIKMLDSNHIVLNASDERGIDVIREKVKTFSSTMSTNGKIKIVFLDEADALTPDAQNSLRNLMETFAGNCRFILTCNYLNKVIEPLQSRCLKIEFNNIDKSEIVDRLKFICTSENIPFEEAALVALVDNNVSDIRKSVNALEEMRAGVTLDKIKKPSTTATQVFANLMIGDFQAARQLYLDAHLDNDQFLKDLYSCIMESDIGDDFKRRSIREIAEAYKFINQVAWKEILVENALLNIMDIAYA